MEELQDAIEDAQYVSAIASVEDGPRPVLPWPLPEEGELGKWMESVKKKEKSSASKKQNEKKKTKETEPFSFEWTLAHALGFFLFSAYLKESVGEHVEINFIEEVLRWKDTRGRFRAEKTSFILASYLSPLTPEEKKAKEEAEKARKAAAEAAAAVPAPSSDGGGSGSAEGENGEEKPQQPQKSEGAPPNTAGNGTSSAKKIGPPKTEISEHYMLREPTSFSEEELEEIRASSDPMSNHAGVGGAVLESLLTKVEGLRMLPGYEMLNTGRHDDIDEGDEKDHFNNENGSPREEMTREEMKLMKRSIRNLSMCSNELPNTLFDKAEALVADNVREKYWDGFTKSKYHEKLLNFLWYQDRTVVEEDFFVMRVLGRGGFGLVTACKKGTSGKLYAMKVMNKKRIKIKKAEQLTLNEQKCLADINSPFVVNLKYSFQSPTDVFLILDLMTGGDLSYHLSQRGCFRKDECLFYGARIMLGLQALHDRGYVYRDLKPENCLLGEDGRVKLTDLGLATKVTKTLHGAAGTRGYWAPEMLRRDENGKRKNYGHMVDWFSFGCCLAEFISGTNPFRSEMALNFGLEKGKKTKEKAIDCATLEMNPQLDPKRFNEDAADICRRLLDKNEVTRLGVNGCEEIMSHAWFREVNWEDIISDKMRPPFVPPKDVNAASQSEIGTFAEDKTFHETVLSEKDEAVYTSWNFTNEKAFGAEVIEFLIYERETGEPLLPIQQNTSCCCTIL
mmetsp:Transcript_19400/g.40921  ORF Transcript_19400/g.40921 Transcript_19400/m.40921 type:complete len:733 (-) Transcript_19400:80-2278(-)